MVTCINTCRADGPQFSRGTNPGRSADYDYQCKLARLCRPSFSDHDIGLPFGNNLPKIICKSAATEGHLEGEVNDDLLWLEIVEEARSYGSEEPILSGYYQNLILSHDSLESALANHLSSKLSSSNLFNSTLYDIFKKVFADDPDIMSSIRADLRAVRQRDPACLGYVHCLLNFKGFLACQAHRVAHKLWSLGRKTLALVLQNRVSEVFAVDIHPGARIGKGILFDHGNGIVIGETAEIGDNVSILHNVTLGGTGKESGDRHPKIGDWVLIGAGTCILGNIRIGDGAKIGAGSVVLKDVPPRTTSVGNPARLIAGKENPINKLDQVMSFNVDSHLCEWSDYVI